MRFNLLKTGLAICLIFFYTFISYARNIVWTDEYSLWHDALIGSAVKSRPHLQFGIALLKVGRIEQAVEKFKFVKQNDPQKFAACINLGGAYLLMKNWDGAEAEFKEAVLIQPDNALAHTNLGLALLNKKLYNDAIKEFRIAIEYWPDNYAAHLNLSTAYKLKGRFKDAEEEARIAAILKQVSNVHDIQGFEVMLR